MDERLSQSNERALRNDPDSLAPIALDRLSVEEEVALMNRGKGGQVALVLALVLVAGAGVSAWMHRVDVDHAYAAAAGGIDQTSQQHADAFLRCALPGVDQAQMVGSDHLQNAIERVSDQLGKRYVRQLARCAPLLDTLVPELSAVRVPADASASRAALAASAAKAALAWQQYQAYLRDGAAPYDYVQAAPKIEKIALAWQAYEDERAAVTSGLRAHR